MMSFARFWLLIIVTVLLVPAAEEDSVGDVLKEQKPIWYDSVADDWKRIEAKAPEQPTRRMPNNDVVAQLFTYIMLTVVIIAAAILIYLLVKNFQTEASVPLSEVKKSAVARAVADLSALPFTDEEIGNPEEALEKAKRQKNWRRAIAISYALHLAELDHGGVLTVARGTTNKGYLRVVEKWTSTAQPRKPVQDILTDTIATFERTWFGHHDANESMFEVIEKERERFNKIVKKETAVTA